MRCMQSADVKRSFSAFHDVVPCTSMDVQVDKPWQGNVRAASPHETFIHHISDHGANAP